MVDTWRKHGESIGDTSAERRGYMWGAWLIHGESIGHTWWDHGGYMEKAWGKYRGYMGKA